MIRLQVFTAAWAPPAPSTPENIPVEIIDADADPDALERLGLKGLPAIVARGELGQVLGCMLGQVDEAAIGAWLEGLKQ